MFASVVWPKGRPPSDKPECGFNNELCEWLTNGRVTPMMPHSTSNIIPLLMICRGQANHLDDLLHDVTQTSPWSSCSRPSPQSVCWQFCTSGSSFCRSYGSRRGWMTPAGGWSTTATSPLSGSPQYERWHSCPVEEEKAVTVPAYRFVCLSARELSSYLWAPLLVRTEAVDLSPISPPTATAWRTGRGRNTSTPP